MSKYLCCRFYKQTIFGFVFVQMEGDRCLRNSAAVQSHRRQIFAAFLWHLCSFLWFPQNCIDSSHDKLGGAFVDSRYAISVTTSNCLQRRVLSLLFCKCLRAVWIKIFAQVNSIPPSKHDECFFTLFNQLTIYTVRDTSPIQFLTH